MHILVALPIVNFKLSKMQFSLIYIMVLSRYDRIVLIGNNPIIGIVIVLHLKFFMFNSCERTQNNDKANPDTTFVLH
jgi:hypothetical protein